MLTFIYFKHMFLYKNLFYCAAVDVAWDITTLQCSNFWYPSSSNLLSVSAALHEPSLGGGKRIQ